MAYAEDLHSEFDETTEDLGLKSDGLLVKAKLQHVAKADKNFFRSESDREGSIRDRPSLLALDAYSRHKRLINEYILCHPGAATVLKQRDTSRDRTDLDVIRQNAKFLWDEAEPTTWEQKLAKKYYDKLFKEYCVTDLSRFKENKIAMRWRTEPEVVEGKGQFVCGEKRCKTATDLTSWEVNFGYIEQSEKKNALVKLRLCPICSQKLNYHHKRKEVVKRKKRKASSAEEEETDKKLKKIEVESGEAKEGQTDSTGAKPSESQIWSKPAELDEEKTREAEFEEYLDDLFL